MVSVKSILCFTQGIKNMLLYPHKMAFSRGESSHMFVGIRDFHKNETDQDAIIAMDMSEHVGFRPLTRKKGEHSYTSEVSSPPHMPR